MPVTCPPPLLHPASDHSSCCPSLGSVLGPGLLLREETLKRGWHDWGLSFDWDQDWCVWGGGEQLGPGRIRLATSWGEGVKRHLAPSGCFGAAQPRQAWPAGQLQPRPARSKTAPLALPAPSTPLQGQEVAGLPAEARRRGWYMSWGTGGVPWGRVPLCPLQAHSFTWQRGSQRVWSGPLGETMEG